MLCIKIITISGGVQFEGSLNYRQLNELLKSYVDLKEKEIRLGNFSYRKSDILDIRVFVNEGKKVK